MQVSHWLDWASSKESGGIHPSITAFINDHPDTLFGEVDSGDFYADPSPRSWHNASNLLNFGEKRNWPHKLMMMQVSGFVGKKAGIQYSSYFDHYQVLLPMVEKIMKGENPKGFDALEPGRKMVCSMLVCSRTARVLDAMTKKNEFPMSVDYVGKFLKNVDTEMALISIRSQIGLQRTIDSGLMDHKAFDEILAEVAKRIKV